MKNLINENLIDSGLLFDFNSAIKKLELSESLFSYEPFNLGFILNPQEIYLVIDYEFFGNYLIKILDNKFSALVLKGYKLGKNISNSKTIARNPFTCIGEDNSLKYFKLIKLNNEIKENKISNNYSFINSSSKSLPDDNFITPQLNTPICANSNHNEKILKIMDKLIEMHFNNSSSKSNNKNSSSKSFIVNSKNYNLNEIIPKDSYKKSLNEIVIPNNQSSKNHEEIMKIQKWKNELYSILF